MFSKLSAKWKAFRRKRPVKITLKILSAIFKCLATIILVGAITASVVGCVMMVYVFANFGNGDDMPSLDVLMENETSIVYVKDSATGEFVEQQRMEGTNSIWKDLEEMPLHMQHAIVAIEDERFYDHYGVDWKRTISAMANLVLHFSDVEYGGSTITQQLVRLVTDEKEHSIQRKITEIFRAIELEQEYYTKEQILEAYVNIMPLTGNIVGVGAGANYYFGKEVEDLSLAECAVLASITNNPSLYNPYTHPENVRSRQRVVLRKMYELEWITEEEYKQALGEELHFQSSVKNVGIESYYTDLLVEDVIAALQERYGYTYRYAENMVYHGGLRIYSAEDPEQQKLVEDIFADEDNFPASLEGDEEDPQSAIYIMDYTGRTVATVGARGEKTANRVLNRATQSTRQPGSAMKPIGVYAPAIQMNIAHFSSLEHDMYITLPDGSRWPVNYESRLSDNGYTPLEVALQKSLNTVPVRLLQEVTPQRSFDFLTGPLGLTSLVTSLETESGLRTDIDLAPLALGGLTKGVYCRDMAAAYQVFGNGGTYNKPYTFYRVADSEGEELLKGGTQMTVQALDTDSAYVMNRLLQRVIRGPSGTGRGLQGSWSGDWGVFAKTGTTSDNKDVYFAGGTPYFVGACWFGYDDNQQMISSQTGGARSLWNAAMLALHQNLEAKNFDEFKGTTVEAPYCSDTGMLATSNCPHTATGVYKADNTPGYCTTHPESTPDPKPDPDPDPVPDPSEPGSNPSSGEGSNTGSSAPSDSSTPPASSDASKPEEE